MQGKGNTPAWLQAWTDRASYAVLSMTLIGFAVSVCTGEVVGVGQKTGDIKEDVKPFDNQILAICFTALKYFTMIGLYVGAIAAIYGIITFDPVMFFTEPQ